MEQANKTSTAKWWGAFFLSVIVSVVVYFVMPSLTTLTFVPVFTTFVKALDII